MATTNDQATVTEPGHVKLWDLPVRLVHWSFVAILPALWWTAENGQMETHIQLGMVMLILVLFRILWGLFGSSTARFAHFVRGPVGVGRYVRGLFGKEGEPIVGHNPLGALSVVALLLLLGAQVVFGLFATDTDGLYYGPLNSLVGYDAAEKLTEWHELGFNVILAVVVLHVAAILFYLTVKRDNLVGPMITGRKRYTATVAAPSIAPWWRGLLCLVIAWAVAGWVWSGAPGLEMVLPAPY